MTRPLSFRLLTALIVSLGVMASACDATTSEEPQELPRPRTVSQATYGGDLLKKVGNAVATGSTLGKTNEVTPSCDVSGNPASPDVSYTWTPPYTDDYTISTVGSNFDTILVVRTYQGSVLVDCNDNASGSQSSLTLNLTGGTAYIITVDGAGTSSGSYQLNIDSVSCPGACKPPDTGCYGPTSICDTTNNTCLMTYLGDDTACNDNNACTTNDRCNGFGGCGGTTTVCNAPPGQCYNAAGTCNPSTGACDYAPKSSGTACNDGNACTLNEVCNGAGSCGSGTAKTCNSPPSQCHQPTGTCNSSTGACTYAFKSSGTACNDGNACTLSEVCDGAGSCGGGTAKSCNSPPGQCYNSTGTCNTSTGACSYTAKTSGTSCSDGMSCTSYDKCDGFGNCESGSENCPRKACSMGFCGATGACEYEYMCLEGEFCSGGRCL